jgi:hypothetical protein
MYVLKTYDGLKLKLEDSEAKKLLEVINHGQQKNIIVQENYFAVANIASIIREEAFDETDFNLGVLHDGSRVIRQFGQWFCLNGDVNEKGHYEIRPDPQYFPEVAMDCVPSVKTFELKYKSLPLAERKIAICGEKDPQRYLKGDFNRISDVMNGKTEEKKKEISVSDWCKKHDTYLIDCDCYN